MATATPSRVRRGVLAVISARLMGREPITPESNMQKLTRSERKALARAADARAARPTYAAQTRGPATAAPCKGKTLNGAHETRVLRGRTLELGLPSPNDAAERARFEALHAVHTAEYERTIARAHADNASLYAAHHATHAIGVRGTTRTRQSRPALNAIVYA